MRSIVLIFLLTMISPDAAGQERLFGSIDDPAEQPSRLPWLSEGDIGVFTGFSLIGPQWRTAGRIRAELRTPTVSTRLSGILRAGLYGTYNEDIDEPYDLLRTIEFIHVQSRDARSYLRLGPLDRTRLGLGQVVNFFNSSATWDHRSLGVEAAVSGRIVDLSGFLDDIRVNGVWGGRLALHPFGLSKNNTLASIEVAGSGVWDREATPDSVSRFSATSFEVQMEAWRSGAFSLHPFAGYSQSRHRGRGVLLGATFSSDNFIDTARLHFRVALHLNTRRFLSGYVGPFWMVNSPNAGILASEDIDAQADPTALAGTPIDAVPSHQALETELRILIFNQVEFWYRFLRNFASPSLSEFNTRVFVRARQFRLMIGHDRGDLTGFFSLLNDLGDINLLRFEAAYRVRGIAWILIEARYTYTREAMPDGTQRFRVERRFDPLLGLRFSL